MKHRGAAEGEARRSDGRVRRASLQVDDLVLDLGRLERRGEARRVDSYREGIHRNRSSRGVVEDALVTLSDTDFQSTRPDLGPDVGRWESAVLSLPHGLHMPPLWRY